MLHIIYLAGFWMRLRQWKPAMNVKWNKNISRLIFTENTKIANRRKFFVIFPENKLRISKFIFDDFFIKWEEIRNKL